MGGHPLLENSRLENPIWLFGGEMVIWSKSYETNWIEDISHAKSNEKANGFKAFLILSLMNPII